MTALPIDLQRMLRTASAVVPGHEILCNLHKAVEIRECFNKARVAQLMIACDSEVGVDVASAVCAHVPFSKFRRRHLTMSCLHASR